MVFVLLTIAPGQFEAFASDTSFSEKDDVKKQHVVIHLSSSQSADIFPKDVLQLLLIDTSSLAHPVDLQLVCKSWRNTMRENNFLQIGINFSELNPFMKTCMNVY